MKNRIFSFSPWKEKIIALCCLLALIIVGTCGNTTGHATSPHYSMTFSLTNFTSQALLAEAVDLSDPANSIFQLENGSHLWYGISIKSLPANILPSVANQSSDLIATTFFNTIPLLPPAQLLPFDQQKDGYTYEGIKLHVSLYGPGQQVQLMLSPLDSHAVTLDILDLLLNLLGQHAKNISIGLLAPGTLAGILALATTMTDFQALIKSYTGALHAATNADKVQAYAHQCASNLTALLSNAEEQSILADMLWKMQGKAILNANILTTITQFSKLPFTLALTDSISTMTLSLSSTLLQTDIPFVTIQTAPIVTPTPKPTPTPTPSPSPIPTPTPTPSPSPSPIPTPTPTPSPSPIPTPIIIIIFPTPTSVIIPTPKSVIISPTPSVPPPTKHVLGPKPKALP